MADQPAPQEPPKNPEPPARRSDLEILEILVREGTSVGIHWTGEKYRIVTAGTSPIVAEDKELGKAVIQILEMAGKMMKGKMP